MGVPEVTKYFVFLGLNVVIAFCGAILLAFGAILEKDEHKGVKSFGHMSVGGFGIGIGILGLAAATWGIWALFKRKPSYLLYFAICLLMLFTVQIILGAVALGLVSSANKDDDDTQKAVEKLFMRQDDIAVKRINHLQKNFHCCGVTGPAWWKQMYNRPIPVSCCSEMKDPCTTPYEKGCAVVYASAIERRTGVIGGVAVGFSPVLLVTAVLAWYVRLAFKRVQYT